MKVFLFFFLLAGLSSEMVFIKWLRRFGRCGIFSQGLGYGELGDLRLISLDVRRSIFTLSFILLKDFYVLYILLPTCLPWG